MASACGTTCDGTCGWCRLTSERDALKAEVVRVAAKLHDGTLHESTCSANHDKEVGGDTCSCTLGRRLKAMKAEVARLKADDAATRGYMDRHEQETGQLKSVIDRLNGILAQVTDRGAKALLRAESAEADAKRLREAILVALPRFCVNTCEHDDNYGSVKYHDDECSNIRRLLGQDVDEHGRIRDAGEEKRV
jgi:hypothetical protein